MQPIAATQITIKYGICHDIVGPATEGDGIVFVPVRFSFDYEFDHPDCEERWHSHLLTDHCGPSLPESLLQCRDQYGHIREEVWVRARFSNVLGFAPPSVIEEVVKYHLTEQVFLACSPVSDGPFWEAIPFLCASSFVLFPPDGPPQEIQLQIADAFWQLFLVDPDELTSFEDGHSEDEMWGVTEFREGKIIEYCDDFEDWEDE